MHKFIENGSITSVKGIKANGIHVGLKRKKKDLALIYSDTPCTAAGTFTLNKVKAAPLLISKEIIETGNDIRAILINSGNANACTGDKGYFDALTSLQVCAKSLKLKSSEVLISSTGVIGERLNMQLFVPGIKNVCRNLTYNGGHDAAEAILTTDLRNKEFAVKVKFGESEITIGAICKGSGMIMPNMATMLAFIATDAVIERTLLKKLLSEAVGKSFNKISVDGETSTNDMVILLANGISGVRIIENSDSNEVFKSALEELTREMAKSIIADGEGATKLIEISVNSAKSDADADRAAKFIANSPLVKTALNGSDANWGRIISALGSSDIHFNPEKVEIKFGELSVLKPPFIVSFCEDEARKILSEKEVKISIELNEGSASSTWYTCDFSEKYIQINSSYRS